MVRSHHRSGPWSLLLLVLAGLLAACGPAVVGPRPPGSPTHGAGEPASSRLPARPRPSVKVELVGWTSEISPPLARPIAVAVDQLGHLYVADAGHQRIVAFDAEGRLLTTWGGPGKDIGQFRFFGAGACDDAGGAYACLPDVGGGVAVDRQGRVLVADWGNHRVQVFDQHGHLLTGWGQPGDGPGQFRLPSGIAVDDDGHIFVSDTGNRRVQKFDHAGAFLGEWGRDDTGAASRFAPGALAVDKHGQVYVLDPVNSRVEQFDGSGRSLARWAIEAMLDGEARPVAGIAVDRQGQVFVAGADDLIHQFDQAGHPVRRWDRSWRGEGRLLRPAGLAVNDRGDLFVADQGRERVPAFRLAPVTPG